MIMVKGAGKRKSPMDILKEVQKRKPLSKEARDRLRGEMSKKIYSPEMRPNEMIIQQKKIRFRPDGKIVLVHERKELEVPQELRKLIEPAKKALEKSENKTYRF